MPQADDFYRIILEQSSAQATHHAETLNRLGKMHGDIESILREAQRTNGRVSKLENEVVALKGWRWYIIGGGTAVVALFEAFRDKIKL